jgi:putative transposase
MKGISNIIKSYEYRIYPNKNQQEQLEKVFGCSRWVYNWALNKRSVLWTTEKKNVSYLKLANELPILKKQKDTKWLAECPSQCLQMSLRNLDNAYSRFFKKQNKFPNFKSKKGKQTIQFPTSPQLVKITNNKLYIPTIGLMLIVTDKQFKGKIKIITIKKSKTNKYYVVFNIETNQIIPTKQKIILEKSIGIDVGIKSFLTTSNGLKIENKNFTKKYENKLAKAQKRLSRKKLSSNNREKQRIKVAKINEKVANIRNNFLHNVTSQLTNDSQISTIFIEDLNIAGMLKNHHLAKSIQDCSWSEFFRQLEYKCLWKGINLVKIGRFDP